MFDLYNKVIRPTLFLLDPEEAHHIFLKSAPYLHKLGVFQHSLSDTRLVQDFFGVRFENPLGLAAGFDKNCEVAEFLSGLGFGHIEIGTVTPRAQLGNPKPRIFRLSQDQALINRMGFPSQGAEQVAQRISRVPQLKARLAVNLGKNKDTALDSAADDYCHALRAFKIPGVIEKIDFFVVNISSPNTPDLRKLQEREALRALVKVVQQELRANTEGVFKPKPLLVKIAPDLTNQQITDVVDVALSEDVAGLIATNTTFSRAGLKSQINQQGGLSGSPLFSRAKEVVSFISKESAGRIPIIAVGGVANADDLIEMIKAGASLVQIYTSLVYQGPRLVARILSETLAKMELIGCKSLLELRQSANASI